MIAAAASAPASTVWWAPSDDASCQRGRLGVDGDDGRRGDRPQDLHRQVAEPADADDDRDRTGPEAVERAPDRPVRRHRGVGERRGEHRVEVTERGELAHAVDDHVRRHPAVDAEAPTRAGELGDAVADVLVAGLAAGARAAAERAVDGDRLADLEPGGPVPSASTQPGRLVAERERQVGVEHAGVELVDHVQVGVADARRPDPHEHLAGAGLGLGTSWYSGAVFHATMRYACMGGQRNLTPSVDLERGPWTPATSSRSISSLGLYGHVRRRRRVGPLRRAVRGRRRARLHGGAGTARVPRDRGDPRVLPRRATTRRPTTSPTSSC